MRQEQTANRDVRTGKSVRDQCDETCNNRLPDSGFSTTPCSDPRVLILGSFPSRKSLERVEYYGNQKNHFWRIMEVLLSIDSTLPYADRIRALGERRIVLWDLVRSCRRNGSMDSDIQEPALNEIPHLSKGTQGSGSSPSTGQPQEDILNGSGSRTRLTSSPFRRQARHTHVLLSGKKPIVGVSSAGILKNDGINWTGPALNCGTIRNR
jgi:hypoxanthine-DNA glycosylase